MKGGPGRGQCCLLAAPAWWPTAGDMQCPREAAAGTDLNHRSWFTWDCCGEITRQKTASLLPGSWRSPYWHSTGPVSPAGLGCPRCCWRSLQAPGWPALCTHLAAGALCLPRNMARGLQGSAGLELWHVLPIQAAPQVNFPSVHGQLCGLGCASSVFVCLSCFFYP